MRPRKTRPCHERLKLDRISITTQKKYDTSYSQSLKSQFHGPRRTAGVNRTGTKSAARQFQRRDDYEESGPIVKILTTGRRI